MAGTASVEHIYGGHARIPGAKGIARRAFISIFLITIGGPRVFSMVSYNLFDEFIKLI
ncbi:unnamed protein product [Schistosoma margrebowiei]|uniref:Uncharacterized protein n=1 Tax=Schistosoma margrebowiei TaxID=48269 RepID=A0A183LX98_9TREM|nr:unnamed protein product [Schistosoma margrebowiei]